MAYGSGAGVFVFIFVFVSVFAFAFVGGAGPCAGVGIGGSSEAYRNGRGILDVLLKSGLDESFWETNGRRN